MFVKKTNSPRTVTLPDGRILTAADLPQPSARWVVSRKETVVLAVTYGLIARGEALRRYGLSDEEFDHWTLAMRLHGRAALKVGANRKLKQPKVARHDFQGHK